jgi:hypothetical protein
MKESIGAVFCRQYLGVTVSERRPVDSVTKAQHGAQGILLFATQFPLCKKAFEKLE